MTIRFALIPLSLALLALPVHAQDTGVDPMVGSSGTATETRLQSVEEQMRAMNGKLEQLEYANRRLEQTLEREQSDNATRFGRLEAAPVASQVAPQQVPAAAVPAAQTPTIIPSPAATTEPTGPTTATGQLGSIKMQDGKIIGGSVSPKSTPLPKVPDDYSLNPQEQYDRAFGLLRQANYEGAQSAFKSFIDKNPNDKLIDNAKYWYGETLYVRGQFNDSALAFADAYQQNPKGQKAPDSLLKLAMSLENIDKKPDACTTLASLKSQFPNAPLTVRSRADEERTKLKCGK